MAVDVVIVVTDPDKRLTQRHVAHSVFDPGNPKEIIDGAFNTLVSSYPTTKIRVIYGPPRIARKSCHNGF